MDLSEAMMKPSRHNNGIIILVFRKPLQKILNFLLYVNWRAIFMFAPVKSTRIIWMLFKPTFE